MLLLGICLKVSIHISLYEQFFLNHHNNINILQLGICVNDSSDIDDSIIFTSIYFKEDRLDRD